MAPRHDLVELAVRGNVDALSSLLVECGPKVRQRLSIDRHFQSAIDPADIMQVTYLEAFLRIESLTGRTVESFIAWLNQIAQNNLRDAIRELERDKRPDRHRQVQQDSTTTSTEIQTILSDSMTASRTLLTIERDEVLRRAMQRLTSTYRLVVQLVDVNGLTPTQAGVQMRRTTTAIYMLRSRALDRLREILGDDSFFLS